MNLRPAVVGVQHIGTGNPHPLTHRRHGQVMGDATAGGDSVGLRDTALADFLQHKVAMLVLVLVRVDHASQQQNSCVRRPPIRGPSPSPTAATSPARDLRPARPPVPGPPRRLRPGYRPPRRPLRPRIPHRGQPAVHHISADLPAAAVNQAPPPSGGTHPPTGPAAPVPPGQPQPRANATYRATVLRSAPVSRAAEYAQPLRSNASRISMISLPDLVTVPPGRWARNSHLEPIHPGGITRIRTRRTPGDQMTAHREF